MALSVLMLCVPNIYRWQPFSYHTILVFCPFSHEKIDINPEKCIWIIESSDNQIDKPQRGCPKRAELPDAKINTKMRKAYILRNQLLYLEKSRPCILPSPSSCLRKKTVLITSKKKSFLHWEVTLMTTNPLPHFVFINFINFRFLCPLVFQSNSVNSNHAIFVKFKRPLLLDSRSYHLSLEMWEEI